MEKKTLRTHLLLLAVAIMLAEQASAANLVISEVLYNPEGTDSGKEFIELYNNGDTELAISNWTIESAGTSFSTAIAIPDGETIPAKSHYLIGGDQMTTTPDLQAVLSLQNGGTSTDGVRIKDENGTVIDTLLYDIPNTNNLLGEGEPASAAPEGKSLSRTLVWDTYDDTQDNSMDFLVTDPTPTAKNIEGTTSDIIVTVEVLSSPPVIENATILQDDDIPLDGIQLIPQPGQQREITLQAWVMDADSHDNIAFVRAELLGQNITLSKILGEQNYAQYQANLTLDYYLAAGNYSVSVYAYDQEGNLGESSTNFSYAELLALDIDSAQLAFPNIMAGQNAIITGDNDMTTTTAPTLKNVGNVNISIHSSTPGLTNGLTQISPENIGVSVGEGNYTQLSFNPQAIRNDFTPTTLEPLNLNLTLPEGIVMGSYSGTIKIITTG